MSIAAQRGNLSVVTNLENWSHMQNQETKDICLIAHCTLSLYIFGEYLYTNKVNCIQLDCNTF